MKILVTGGAGFIGANLVYQLISLGGEVFVLDDLSTGKPENIDPRGGFRKVDICDEEFLGAVRAFKPDCIVHLAAQPSVAESIKDPEKNDRINIEGTKNVIAAALENKVERLVFASSAAVYGDPAELPIKESAPLKPLSPYGESKLEAERLIDEELRGSGVDFAILRFANVYGPRQNAEGEGGVVSAMSFAVAAGEQPVMYGDGNQTRDFIFVGDVVSALISAIGGDIDFAGDPSTTPEAGRYNICTGTGRNLHELVSALRIAATWHGPVREEAPREGDIRDSVLDPSRAREVFEFEAVVDFETGVSMTYDWVEMTYKEQMGGIDEFPPMDDDPLFGTPIMSMPPGMELPGSGIEM